MRVEDRDSYQRESGGPPGRNPMSRQRTAPRFEAGARVVLDRRAVKSTAASASPATRRARAERRPETAAAQPSRRPMQPCRIDAGSRRGARSLGPTRPPSNSCQRRNVVGGNGVDPLHDLVEREQLGVGDQRLPQPAHPVRRRLHRQQHPSLQVLLRTLELAGAHVSRRDVPQLTRDDLEALDEVLLPRADVEPELAGVRVLRGEAVDRVRHPSLLTDLLKEPRGGRTAENRLRSWRCGGAGAGYCSSSSAGSVARSGEQPAGAANRSLRRW